MKQDEDDPFEDEELQACNFLRILSMLLVQCKNLFLAMTTSNFAQCKNLFLAMTTSNFAPV